MHHRPVSFWAGVNLNRSIKERPMDEVVEERLDERLTQQCSDECYDDDMDADDGFEL
jgi:hypothetical protein